jgi:hypothetical protein
MAKMNADNHVHIIHEKKTSVPSVESIKSRDANTANLAMQVILTLLPNFMTYSKGRSLKIARSQSGEIARDCATNN